MSFTAWTWLANPARFTRLSRTLRPWLAAATLGLFALGLVLALLASPPDYQQGETVRIMYVHVPAAWLALLVYLSMAIAAAVGLIWRHLLAELFVRAVAPIGAAFTLVCLVTGSLWGAPTWGTWWEWDARLTSVLILFFLYVGYQVLADAYDDPERGARAGAFLVLVGAVNLPIIKFSVDWWSTLHQPASILRLDGPAIHPSMLWPLLVMALAYLALYLWLALVRLDMVLTDRRARARLIIAGF